MNAKHNGISSRPIQKRRSPPRRTNANEINYAYVDSQILQRPQTVKQTTPAEMLEAYDVLSLHSEFEIDAYASNDDLIRRLVPINV